MSGQTIEITEAIAERAHRDPLAWVATALCVLGLIITAGGSSLGAALFLAIWGVVGVVRADSCLRLVFRSPVLWLVPGLALLSVAWSVAPAVSLRAAVELALTVGAASLAVAFLRPRGFVAATSLSLLVGAGLTLLFGRDGLDGLTGGVVFMGIFGSKNTMALFMSLQAIFAAAVLADRGQHWLMRLLAVASFALSIPLLVLAHSAGATMTTIGSLGVLFGVAGFARLAPRGRLLALAGFAVLLLAAALLLAVLALNGMLAEAYQGFLTQVLGKDATLTGRTELWQIALTEIARRPLAGTGYYAFWMQGNLLAESIWRSFSIATRMGFHFHNTFLEFAVELGWPGVAALVVTLVLAVERVLRLALADRTMASAALVATICCLVARTIGEVDAPYPFSIGTFLLFAVAAYGADFARWAGQRTPVAAVVWPQGHTA